MILDTTKTNPICMATITESSGQEFDVLVVLVEGGHHRVVGLAHIEDLMTCPACPIYLVDPANEKSCLFHPEPYHKELTGDPGTIEALREAFRAKPSEPDLQELQRQIVKVKSSIKRDARFDLTDRIPVPKRYQRNRFKR